MFIKTVLNNRTEDIGAIMPGIKKNNMYITEEFLGMITKMYQKNKLF